MVIDALLRFAASFAAGFAVVATVTYVADWKGKGPAGFIGGLPWAGPVSLLAIGYTQTPAAAIKAVTTLPLGFGAVISFLLFYAVPRSMSFRGRMGLALGLWALAAVGFAIWAPDDFAASIAVELVVSFTALYARSKVVTKKEERKDSKPRWKDSVLRGSLGGAVVTGAAVIGLIAGGLAGGVFAAAPAAWSSSLYVTSRSQSLEFSRALTWDLMKTAVMTIIPFTVVAYYTFSYFGIVVGTLLSYLAISPPAYMAWKLKSREN